MNFLMLCYRTFIFSNEQKCNMQRAERSIPYVQTDGSAMGPNKSQRKELTKEGERERSQ